MIQMMHRIEFWLSALRIRSDRKKGNCVFNFQTVCSNNVTGTLPREVLNTSWSLESKCPRSALNVVTIVSRTVDFGNCEVVGVLTKAESQRNSGGG